MLHKRFSPHATKIALLDSKELVFWVENYVEKIGSKLNAHLSEDPFSLPEGLVKMQLGLKKDYSIHHPKVIAVLIQSHMFPLAVGVFRRMRDWLGKK